MPLTPEQISYGSRKRVWWRCADGHIWQAYVYSRTGDGTGCPYCAGRKACPGKTDLATLYPGLVREWHPTQNLPLTPEEILPGSHRKVWWKCQKGHQWQATVKSRVSGCGCPVCANHKVIPTQNDLKTAYPEIASQWHPTKNGELTAADVTPGSKRRVWWQCEKGHVWQAVISSRTSGGCGCPVCAGRTIVAGENDLAACFPALAKQWHPTRNGQLMPQQISPYSNRKVWWQCSLGHAFQATVAARAMRKIGCPYCAGKRVMPGFNDLASREPEIAMQWHPTLNGVLTPQMVTPGSRQKVWWQCPEGHVWKAVVYSRAGGQKSGCPVCAGKTKLRGYAALVEVSMI